MISVMREKGGGWGRERWLKSYPSSSKIKTSASVQAKDAPLMLILPTSAMSSSSLIKTGLHHHMAWRTAEEQQHQDEA